MSRARWMLGLAGLAAYGSGALLALALEGDAEHAPPPPGASRPGPVAAPAPRPAPPPEPARPVPPIHLAPDDPGRVQPYRPATYLRYSAGVPAASPADDDHAPTLIRLLEVTRASVDQAETLRLAWREHEEGRRAILADTHPSSIGDPVLDPEQLAVLDGAFSDVVRATLDDAQLARLALEMPPEPPPAPPPEP